MFLKKRNVNGTLYWSIAESYREDNKVKQRVIKNLGNTENALAYLRQDNEYTRFLSELLTSVNSKGLEINKIHNMDCREGMKLLAIIQ